jgi:hypothetical protein
MKRLMSEVMQTRILLTSAYIIFYTVYAIRKKQGVNEGFVLQSIEVALSFAAVRPGVDAESSSTDAPASPLASE